MGAPHVLANPPKVALIGGGFIGPVHAEALRRIGIQVAGLLDISPERARPLAERSGITKVYNTLDELLGDPSIDRGAHRLAQPRPLRARQAGPRGRQARSLREAAGHQLEGDRRACEARPRPAPSRPPASITTSASTRCARR